MATQQITAEDLAKQRSASPCGHAGPALVVVVLVAFFLFLPVLYILSIGPAVWLATHGYIEGGHGSLAQQIYAPVEHLAHQSELTEKALRLYVQLWR